MTLAKMCIVLASAIACGCTQAAADCAVAEGVSLQILGSGGPIADDARASSGYVVWVDGASRVLIDAGGGTYLRFGEAGARFEELAFIGLSHLHTDHSADFPALLKSGNFAARDGDGELGVAGPGPRGRFPGLDDYLYGLLNPENGVYGYLSGYLDGTEGLARLAATEVANDESGPVTVFEDSDSDLRIDALPVPHGIVPALGFRVVAGDTSLVFGSDQNGSDPRFVDFAKDADVLVMHMAVPEGVRGPASRLHAEPSMIGDIASRSDAKTLVLSHLMARSLRDLDENVGLVRSRFDGRIVVADDLSCVAATTR